MSNQKAGSCRKEHYWHVPKAKPEPKIDYRAIAARAEPCRALLNILPDLQPDYVEKKAKGKKKKDPEIYCNNVITFDIESTSYIAPGGIKTCWMYCWQCYAFGHVYMGRTWEDWEWFLLTLIPHIHGIIPIYVHNLAFEFSFLKQVFGFDDIFAARPLTPMRARWGKVEYRDSLVLSGLPLSKLPTKTKKLVGDLDYSLIRTEKTKLTPMEIAYCVNDVVVLAEYIESLYKDDNAATIPMTRTGYVRRDIAKRMQPAKRAVQSLKLNMLDYRNLEQMYAGGYTHAAAHTSGMTLHCVRSLDITSSYPTVMIAEQYPMSNFWYVDPDDYEEALKKYCCMARLTIEHCEVKEHSPDCIISASKCIYLSKDAVLNNGRVVSASLLALEVNEVDYKWYKRFYNGDFYLADMRAARKGNLPKPIIEAILYYYSIKTMYKGVKSKKELYQLCKERLNAMYGMSATKILRPLITLIDNIWYTESQYVRDGKRKRNEPLRQIYMQRLNAYNLEDYYEECLEKHNNSYNRVLYYAWAPWITSYARQNLYEMMWKCGEDYHYTDTDSLKITNWHLHKRSFDRYNRKTVRRIHEVLVKLHIDPSLAVPKDPNDIPRPLGVYTDEGEYWDFVTIGAKRYMTDGLDGIEVTCAGAPKKQITKYMQSIDNPFAKFNDMLVVPADQSGKLMATHVETPWEGMVTDYTGQQAYVYAPGGTHLAPMEVTMSISEDYKAYLLQAQAADEMPWVDRGLIG